jgi:hypothetical protein
MLSQKTSTKVPKNYHAKSYCTKKLGEINKDAEYQDVFQNLSI